MKTYSERNESVDDDVNYLYFSVYFIQFDLIDQMEISGLMILIINTKLRFQMMDSNSCVNADHLT
jgi:hypothetical protein